MAKQTKNTKKQPMGRESKILLLVLLIAVALVMGVRMRRAAQTEKSLAELTAALEAAIPAKEAVVVIDGHSCAAMLEPISLGLHLPVLTAYSADTLDVAPAILSGQLGEPGLVIGGSNAKDHLGQLTELFYGDLVWITAVDGTMYEYELDDMMLQSATDPAQLDAGDWDMVLFTQHKKNEYLVAGFYQTEN